VNESQGVVNCHTLKVVHCGTLQARLTGRPTAR
jgi:hypothetical protein